jgi:hypothetical protein
VWSPSLRNHPLWRYFCLFGCILFDTSRLFCTTKQPQFAASSAFAKYQQYVQVIQVGTNTEIKIDADGNGSGTTFTTIARLQNITASTVRSRNIVI